MGRHTALALALALVYYASHPLLLCRQFFIRDDEALYARLKLGDNLPYAWLTESDYTLRFAALCSMENSA